MVSWVGLEKSKEFQSTYSCSSGIGSKESRKGRGVLFSIGLTRVSVSVKTLSGTCETRDLSSALSASAVLGWEGSQRRLRLEKSGREAEEDKLLLLEGEDIGGGEGRNLGKL